MLISINGHEVSQQAGRACCGARLDTLVLRLWWYGLVGFEARNSAASKRSKAHKSKPYKRNTLILLGNATLSQSSTLPSSTLVSFFGDLLDIYLHHCAGDSSHSGLRVAKDNHGP